MLINRISFLDIFLKVSNNKIKSYVATGFLGSVQLCCTHGQWVVYGVLDSSGQALLHHAREAVELMLLVNLKESQQLPLLAQASPHSPLHRARPPGLRWESGSRMSAPLLLLLLLRRPQKRDAYFARH